MANEKVMAVGIKKLYYGPVIEDAAFSGAKLYALLHPTEGTSTFNEVKNVHQDTWQYEEAEASVTEYKNQLTGNTYRDDREPGSVTISFTIGAYLYKEKADLQGGEVITGADESAVGWKRAMGVQNIEKALVAQTKDDQWVVLPKASISARGANTDNAIGLAVVGTMLEPETDGMMPEYWFDDSEVKTAAAMASYSMKTKSPTASTI